MSLPNEHEHEMMEEEENASCSSCRFRTKCKMLNTIMEVLQRLELEMAHEYRIDLDIEAVVGYCPSYVYDPNSSEVEFHPEIDDEAE